MNEYIFIIKLLALTLTAGLLIFIIIGFSRTEQMLRPIAEVTKVATQINGENLNLRIDEKDARYELKELVQTINKMMDRIQVSYNKQKRFVSDVSHELRTPIAVISGYGSMLKRWGKSDPDILDESIDAIINEASNMNDLVEKLLFLARSDNDTISFEMDLCDISKLCKDTIKETMLVHSDFEVKLDIRNQVFAKVDEMRMKQLFRILIDNAVKYSLERKYLVISLKTEDDSFVFSVKDRGIGISKEDLPNIFDRFYRADESRTKSTGGYGLGLAMAKIIALGHHGKIHVVSKLNEGSEFSARIPLNLPTH
jgi:signal transduction histidine kinase